MAAKLYVVPASHPCAAVERALELKGVEYTTVNLVPVFHKVHQRARFGSPGTVPGIVFDGGRKLLGSRAIIRALEADRPEPALLPADAEQRRRVEEAEEWGEQVLQPIVRRAVWQALSRDTSAQLNYSKGVKLFPPTPIAVAKLSGGMVGWAERRINGAGDAAVRADLASLPGHLDRVDGWIADGILGGETPNVADLQIGAALALLRTLGDLAPLIDERPAGGLARREFPDYPGHVPAGTLPAEWLPARAPGAAI